jgi:hypothetical protein
MNPEILEVGERGALICDDGPNTDPLRGVIEALGFKCHVAQTAHDAIERMTYTTYELVAVAEELGGATLPTNPVLLHLSMLPMGQRRNTYTLIVGPSFRTLDAMQAFANSVHLAVNTTDTGNLGPILKRGLADFERLYTTYRNVLRESGELTYNRRRP